MNKIMRINIFGNKKYENRLFHPLRCYTSSFLFEHFKCQHYSKLFLDVKKFYFECAKFKNEPFYGY